jgi:2-C-methyl-D-erythritol 4-phosphate cytidylyltransferase
MDSTVPKQYLPLGGRTVLEYTLDVLFSCERLSGIVLVLAAGDSHWQALQDRYAQHRLMCITGGRERCHSVLNALNRLVAEAQAGDWVLVHDAARPCVRVADVTALMDALDEDSDGGLLGVPVADTMKRTGPDGRIDATVERNTLWHAQTPQMFRLGALRAALEAALAQGVVVTDEAAAMERAGYRPRMVCGHSDNIKITVPEDLALAEFHLSRRTAS